MNAEQHKTMNALIDQAGAAARQAGEAVTSEDVDEAYKHLYNLLLLAAKMHRILSETCKEDK
jgi:hypothetical protein